MYSKRLICRKYNHFNKLVFDRRKPGSLIDDYF